jgi:hypothetical protein
MRQPALTSMGVEEMSPGRILNVNPCSVYSVQGFEKRKKCLRPKLRECKGQVVKAGMFQDGN